ncbi:MAG: hypothetical protein AB8F74_12455 [Saprospiraceae bacterium]
MNRLILALVVLLLSLQNGVSQEAKKEDVSEKPKDEFNIKAGGALRFNYNYSSWKPNQKKRGGDFGFEVFRLNVEANYKKWGLHLDQRFYAADFGGAFLKYGWFQYNVNEKSNFKLGLIPAYFGAQQFNSHSWFFQLPFYLGFEDDHDMGLSYSFENEKFQVDFGLYKNAEELSFSDNAPVSDSRYTYDFSGRNKEVNQVNLRFNYKFGNAQAHKIGSTIQYGGIWNLDTEEMGNQVALGLHYQFAKDPWSIKFQTLYYNNSPTNAPGESRDFIEMTAYGFPYNTASEAVIYTLGIAYTIPVNWKFINSIQIYNDYAYMDKAVNSWEDTQMNVTGILISTKPVYIYVDHALGKHQPWLGPQWTNALTTGDASNNWESRFNINFGFYY